MGMLIIEILFSYPDLFLLDACWSKPFYSIISALYKNSSHDLHLDINVHLLLVMMQFLNTYQIEM